MQKQMQTEIFAAMHSTGGLRVRTGLRGGICVDVDEQVKAALQTLTTALGGTTATTATPTVTASTAPASS